MILLSALMFAVAGALRIATNKSFGFSTDDIFGIFDPASLRSLSSGDVLPLCLKAVGTPLFRWVYAATSIKRLHDRDKSAWWMIPFFLVPGLFCQFEHRLDDSYAVLFFALIASAACGGTSSSAFQAERDSPTGSVPTRWRRATQGRAGINGASWNLCRTALAQRRDLMLSGEHE
jgi:uncharacterized membrane protein YhaH (DUF805 family)